jgi:hypothetical protein
MGQATPPRVTSDGVYLDDPSAPLASAPGPEWGSDLVPATNWGWAHPYGFSEIDAANSPWDFSVPVPDSPSSLSALEQRFLAAAAQDGFREIGKRRGGADIGAPGEGRRGFLLVERHMMVDRAAALAGGRRYRWLVGGFLAAFAVGVALAILSTTPTEFAVGLLIAVLAGTQASAFATQGSHAEFWSDVALLSFPGSTTSKGAASEQVQGVRLTVGRGRSKNWTAKLTRGRRLYDILPDPALDTVTARLSAAVGAS